MIEAIMTYAFHGDVTFSPNSFLEDCQANNNESTTITAIMKCQTLSNLSICVENNS